MKKIILVLLAMFLVGCGQTKNDLSKFREYNETKKTYHLKGDMKIVSNEDEFTYKIDVIVKNQEYYKVSLINTINNHEQIILRNKDGVYVITPSLNKSFKFMSEWPKNSSQAYLIENLVEDVINDKNATISNANDGYTITTKVNYPNNPKMNHEVITVDKNYNVLSVSIKDQDEVEQLRVDVKDIDYKPNINDSIFELSKNYETSNEKCEEEDCKTSETSGVLDEIIYPLYVPVDTYLTSKDTVETKDGNRFILTFAGVDPFILVEEVSTTNSELEIIPVSGEPIQMGSSIGALTNNSLYFTSNGVDYYLTSNTLDAKEMITIAESITNGANLVAGVK